MDDKYQLVETTFMMDFDIADAFGLDAIQDTFNRAFKEWKSNYKMLTALVIALNNKLWQHWELGRHDYGLLYDKLWKEADHYAVTHLKGEELKYFYIVTD